MPVIDKKGSSGREPWNHQTPVVFSPLFSWPPKPRDIFVALTKRWVTPSRNVLFLLLAIFVCRWCLPDLTVMQTLSSDWILPLFLRNYILMMSVAGGLHLYLFSFRAQGSRLKYDHREKLEKGKQFTFRNQVWDNAFWSLAGGATIWSIYEVAYLHAFARGHVPTFGMGDQPVAFVAWLLVLPIMTSSHFYLIHRLLHWPPLYKSVHRLHHRNIHIGPWSGMSMHPVEQIIYMSSVLIHWVVPSHPVIFLLHIYSRCLGPAFSHSGFEKLLAKDVDLIDSADFHHQLHHRYFECNYGTVDAPWDVWFGSDHDGSEEATRRTMERRKRMYHTKT
jgi:Delta7-sterol 5-desaturase